MKDISSSRREIELLGIITDARISLERRRDIDSKNSSPALLEFMSKIISYLQSSVSYVSKGSEVSRKLKEETFGFLKYVGNYDKFKDEIIVLLNLRSRVLISVVKGDNQALISKIYTNPDEVKEASHEGKGILDYALVSNNTDALILLYGIGNITPLKIFELRDKLNQITLDDNQKKFFRFGLDIEKMEGEFQKFIHTFKNLSDDEKKKHLIASESQKFIHTFKNLSDDVKKQLFSSFLEHKKFPNLDSALTDLELQDFFATFRQDDEAFQKLADLIKDKPENKEFIKLINGSTLFDKDFKTALEFENKTLAERLIDHFKSLGNDDDKKRFLTNILQNINPESPSPGSSPLKDEDLNNFFKIFLRDKENENLFDQFRDADKEFSELRGTKEDLIGNICDEIDLEDFITFLNIFSSDLHETSEKIKVQVEEYVPDFKEDSNLAFNKAFDMPENHLALSNLYLNYPEETKEIFTLEKLEILLRSDLKINQKKKIFFKALEIFSDSEEQKILIDILIKSRKDKNCGFISKLESEESEKIFDKLNDEEIVKIILEKPISLNQSASDFAEDAKQLFFEDGTVLANYFLQSDRFDYQVKSNFLDLVLKTDDYAIVRKLNNDNGLILIQYLSCNAIKELFMQKARVLASELEEKLLSTALESENIAKVEKNALLTVLLATNDEKKLNLIYDYLLNKDLAYTQKLLTQEVVGELFASDLDKEKKLILAIKILGDDGLDSQFKKSFNDYLPEEFRSALNQDPQYINSEVKLALSEIISKLEIQEGDTFSAQRVGKKSRSPSPDQTPSQDSSSPVEVASNGSSPSNLGSSETNLSNTLEFSAIRTSVRGSKSSSPIEISSAGSAPSSPVQEISPGSASPVAQGVSTSTSIISATIGIGSSAPNTQSAIGIVDKVLSIRDCEELQKILRGRVFDGFKDYRSYDHPEELIPDSPLRIFHVDYKRDDPFGNNGITSQIGLLKQRFHEEDFDPLFKKIHESDNTFDEHKLKSYLYAILAISSGESDSIPSFYECYDNLIVKSRAAKTVGPGHGSWIESPEHFVKLKIIINKMKEIHDESVAKGNPAFTEKNLKQWMIAQVQDRRIEEFKLLNNKEFVENLIDAFDCSTLDAKTSELKIAEKHLKSFLSKNTSFVEKLANISTDVDDDNKGLANHLLDHLFKNMSSKNSRLSPIAKNTYDQQLEDLRENLTKKILAFKDKLSSGKLSALDSDDHLILDLILEIPTKFDDILKSKFTNNDDQFEVDDKIEEFVEKLGKRKSIFEFRKTCIDQAEIYANKAKEIQASHAKSSQGR